VSGTGATALFYYGKYISIKLFSESIVKSIVSGE
jgi:hypothetical protein